MKQTSLSRRCVTWSLMANKRRMCHLLSCYLVSQTSIRLISSFKRDLITESRHRFFEPLTSVHHEQGHFEQYQVGVDAVSLTELRPWWLFTGLRFRRLRFNGSFHGWALIWRLAKVLTLFFFSALVSSLKVAKVKVKTFSYLEHKLTFFTLSALAREVAISLSLNWSLGTEELNEIFSAYYIQFPPFSAKLHKHTCRRKFFWWVLSRLLSFKYLYLS